MIFKGHWNVRYFINRVNEYLYRKFNPGRPWLTQDAITYLNTWLTPEKIGMEFGSGRSTIWLAERTKHLTSVESNNDWFGRISDLISQNTIRNVDYIYSEVLTIDNPLDPPYLRPLRNADDNSVDFVLVDGDYRDLGALLAISKVKSGGIIIVDNCNWFLPSITKSPSSIPVTGKCKNEIWDRFANETKNWQRKWTSNGVSDTIFFFKP